MKDGVGILTTGTNADAAVVVRHCTMLQTRDRWEVVPAYRVPVTVASMSSLQFLRAGSRLREEMISPIQGVNS